MKFFEFIGNQVNRLSAHEDFAKRMNSDAKIEIASWLLHELGDRHGDKTAVEWQATESGDHAVKLINEAMEFTECPGIVTLRSLYARMWPKEFTPAPNGCRYCGGTGWRIFEGEYGTSGAARCSHDVGIESRRETIIRIPASLARHYRQDQEGAEDRRREAAEKKRAS
jgi:hypothetical protein